MGVNRCYEHGWEQNLGMGYGKCPYCAQIEATNRVAEAVEKKNHGGYYSSTDNVDFATLLMFMVYVFTVPLVMFSFHDRPLWLDLSLMAGLFIGFVILCCSEEKNS
jgi:hypothetical protein